MDSSEKPHRTTSNSELFICFTSRLSSSSSSMKLSSKSILSPGRAREPSQISLSSSLSRRLRSNGSMKGGQASPMFPTGGKKRGNFENPEPSSPKVTCIGQVRVKTKKQGKKMRSRSRKRGEVSFRKVEQSNSNAEAPNLGNLGNFHSDLSHRQQPEGLPHRNQRWVHLPLTICEALRAFGADFNCFLPCRSSCSSRDQKEDHKAEEAGTGGNTTTSCGTVFARWLVAAQEVAAAEESVLQRRSSQRRDVFEGIEFEEEKCESKNVVVEEEEEEEARVSICVPPKNALLLMRCRSDPLRMAALANRFWESPAPQDEDGEDNKDGEDEANGNEEEDDVDEGEVVRTEHHNHKEEEICEKWVAAEALEKHEIPEVEGNGEESEEDDDSEIRELQEGNPENLEEEKELEVNQSLSEEKETDFPSEIEENLGKLLPENEDLPMLLHEHNEGVENEDESEAEHHEEEEERSTSIHTFPVVSVHTEPESEEEEEPEAKAEAEESSMEEKEDSEEEDEPEPENPDSKERPGLPDCLLLMMCEPKLSMEVSKETWVCSTDFIRWHPEKHVEKVKKTDGGDAPKKRISIDSNPAAALPPPPQPARSSCSFPSATAAASSMATMIEHKLVNAVAYEPFVLTRCKSEPMRTAAKLAPEACFWKSRKLEPHKPAVGAAGVGF